MKKLTKIMLSIAAASVVTAAMAVTAMAVDTITGTYDNTTGEVTMNGVLGSGKSQTILVLDSNEDIAYINQIDNNGTFSTFMLAAGLESPTPVTYNIKIGGSDKSLQTGTLTISGSPATVTIVLGDVTDDNKATISDINAIGKYIANRNKPGTGTYNTGVQKTKYADGESSTIVLGDVTDDSKATISDINAIGKYIANRNKPGTGTYNTGVQVEVIVESSAE